jgi:Spy/CpxP family protein refolding chaperone
MERKIIYKLIMVCIIIVALFLLSSWTSAEGKEWNLDRVKEQIKIVKGFKELNLSPEKEKALLNIEQKYAKDRKDNVVALKKYQEDLKVALSATDRDESKIKDLVSSISATQDKLLSSFKMERDEAMALMTPIQQGQFIIMIGNWYYEILKKAGNKKP